VQYFASFNVAEQIYDALFTWNRIGKLEVTRVSLKFFQQFNKNIKIGVYPQNDNTYIQLTRYIRRWADNTVISLSKRTPSNLILPLVMNKTTGEPMPPWGALRSEVAVLGAHLSYCGLEGGVFPASWANGTPGSGTPTTGPCTAKHGHFDGVLDVESDQFSFESDQFSFEFESDSTYEYEY
jgi:glucoamylase